MLLGVLDIFHPFSASLVTAGHVGTQFFVLLVICTRFLDLYLTSFIPLRISSVWVHNGWHAGTLFLAYVVFGTRILDARFLPSTSSFLLVHRAPLMRDEHP